MKFNKRGQYNFVLIFASIAGAIILLLAIYGAVKTGGVFQRQTEAELAKTIDIITNPLQAGFAEGVTSQISFKRDTRITNGCDSFSSFGENIISVQTRSSVGESWTPNALEYKITNKYIFSETTDGKIFYVYSKPFYTGYKVADLIFISTDDYCLISPPEKIEQEIVGLNIPNIGVQSIDGNNSCETDSKRVCFGASGCDIIVVGECKELRCDSEYDFGYVINENGTRKYYSDNLLIGAIISDGDTYECNVKRLLYRSSRIADIFSRKIDLMEVRGCGSLLKTDLNSFASILQNSTMSDLREIYYLANDLDKRNLREGGCRLW